MTFYLWRRAWCVQFTEYVQKTPISKIFTFANSEKVKDLAARGNAFRSLSDVQAFDYAILNGKGGIDVYLSDEQYDVLLQSRNSPPKGVRR